MIQIYAKDNSDYTKNGDMPLLPSDASVHVILNGAWEASLTHPIDADGRWKYIVEEAVVKMPSFNGDQLFRIKTAQKKDSGVTATLEPIFYDAMGDCWLADIRPTGKNGQEALDAMLAPNSKYSGFSNITRTATAYYQNMNFMQALNGDIDQSFTSRWGGEILFDNFTVTVNDRVGGDYGIELRYGKNIPKDGMSYEVDTRDVVTRIYPQAYNGHKMSGGGYVDSPLINNYPTVKATAMTFDNIKMADDAQEDDAQEDDEENGVIICDTQEELDAALTAQCSAQYEAGIDKPTVAISADMVLLQNTAQYRDYKVLETVSLGDTIHIIHTRLGIVSDARILELEYDAIRKCVSSVVIGDYKKNYFDDVTSSVNKIDSVVRPDGTIMAEKIAGFISGLAAQIRLQSTAAQKVDGIAFRIEDLDPDSNTYGCMVWGTQGIQISRKRTADGRDWDWTTAMTASGLVADTIITGVLSDKLGRNYWNLDTGEFSLSSIGFSLDGGSVTDFVKDDVKDYTLEDLTQAKLTDRLNGSGAVQGLVLQNGRLYLNGQAIRSKTISADAISVDDLRALGATIANWHIEESYMWSEYSSGQYAVIKSDGDVMLATASPSHADTTGATLQIFHDGHIAIGDTKNGGIRTEIYGDTLDIYNQHGHAFQLNYNGGMEIWGNLEGNESPYIDFHHAGSMQDYSVRLICSGPDTMEVMGGTLNTESDKKLKKDIRPIDDPFDVFFDGIVPITYRYKDHSTGKRHIGYNANNIQRAAERAGLDISDLGVFSVDKTGTRSLAYQEFSALNTYKIQQLGIRMGKIEEIIKHFKEERNGKDDDNSIF